MSYLTLLFDLDGTLMDFDAAQHEAFFKTFGHFGVAADDAMHQRYDALNSSLWRMLERGEITRGQLFEQRFGRFLKSEGIRGVDPAQVQKRYFKDLSESCMLMEGALELLERLSGRFSLNIITNGVASTQRKRLADSGIERFFDHLVISEEIGFEKPDPRYFRAAKSLCGIGDLSTALVIGDSPTADIFGGGSFGFDTCWFSPKNLEFSGRLPPKYTISSLSELPGLLGI